MTLPRLTLLLLVLVGCPQMLCAEVLQQIISREDARFSPSGAMLVAGRDGRVYLSNEAHGVGGFVNSYRPDGTGKKGFAQGHAQALYAVNSEGNYAMRWSHFAHTLATFAATGKQTGSFTDLANEQYNAPQDVAVGVSNDFYGLDVYHHRIVRLSPQGKLVRAYPLPEKGDYHLMEVGEASQRFYVAHMHGPIIVLDQEGREVARLPIFGAFTTDPQGNVWVLPAQMNTLVKFGPDGKEVTRLDLEAGTEGGSNQTPWQGIGFLPDGSIVTKRTHPYELFVHFSPQGKLLHRVQANYERLAVEVPSLVWTAGQEQPFSITHESSLENNHPRWKIWIRPFNTPWFSALPLVGGKVTAPAETGLYQLKVTTGTNSSHSEYLVQQFVEVRAPGSRGSLALMAPGARVFFAQNEAIPVTLLARGEGLPGNARVTLQQGSSALTATTLPVDPGKPSRWTIPASLTSGLQVGRYQITATVPGCTVMPQHLWIGPGERGRSGMRFLQYGDYGNVTPLIFSLWEAPETVWNTMQRAQSLGMNTFVDRLGSHLNVGAVDWNNESRIEDLRELTARLEKDPQGIPPARVQIDPPLRQMMGGYSATGIHEMAILMYMDAGLPLGTLWDGRKPEVLAEHLTRVTKALMNYPAFKGWSYTANWWQEKSVPEYAANPEERKAYEAAHKVAAQTGKWSPVLDGPADRWMRQPVIAQDYLNGVLDKTAPGLTRANSGPYRAPWVYPPLTFSNLQEVDLHFQMEQINPPHAGPHGVDYLSRPGKPAWGHPEVWNDNGTGDQIVPELAAMIMRGVDGIGTSGSIPNWGRQPEDARNPYPGTPSVFRAVNQSLAPYGHWLKSLRRNDPVAIVLSRRMFGFDWNFHGHLGSLHFTRVFEAYWSSMYAHRPATLLFVEDATDQRLKDFKALLLVDERVELEPAAQKVLQAARRLKIPVYRDADTRDTVAQGTTPLGFGFNRVEKMHLGQNDAAWWEFAEGIKANAAALEARWKTITPVIVTGERELIATEQVAGKGRFLFLVNNTTPDEEPGLLWRVSMALTTKKPLAIPVRIPAVQGKVVYDVTSRQAVNGSSLVPDLRTMPFRWYAVLPTAIAGIKVSSLTFSQNQVKASLMVVDTRGQVVDANLPLGVRLIGADGTSVGDLSTVARSTRGAQITFPVPVNRSRGTLFLVVSDLVAGKGIRVEVKQTVAATKSASAPPRPDAAPRPVAAPAAGLPIASRFGAHLRDGVVLADGKVAIFNAANRDQNLYAVDVEKGTTLWRGRVGDWFSFAPENSGPDMVVQGYDLRSAEGYHLYKVDAQGKVSRRFALPGLPKRLTGWSFSAILNDRINQFATAPDGSWLAAAGDLGLAVWKADGNLQWKQNWSDERPVVVLRALNNNTLVVAREATVTAYQASDGAQQWQQTLAASGRILSMSVGTNGSLLVRGDSDGGKVWVRGVDGKLISFTTPSDIVAISPDGQRVAVLVNQQVRLYDLGQGLQWTWMGSATLHHPRFSPDGSRLVVADELGMVTVLDREGTRLYEVDAEALATPLWVGQQLVLGTWAGNVIRLGDQGKVLWTRKVTSAPPASGTTAGTNANLPTARMDGWTNQQANTLPLQPNLLQTAKASVYAYLGDRRQELQQPTELLSDGALTPPTRPWMDWAVIQMIDSGWSGSFSLEVDTFRTQMKVTGITLAEDPAHPESWLRDARLQSWNASTEEWVDVMPLLSDSALHTHLLPQPVETQKLRLVASPGGNNWPVSNLRLAELVIHGEVLGASHPDIVAKRSVATLFDEQLALVKPAFQHGHNPGFSLPSDTGAFSGAWYIKMAPDRVASAAHIGGYGHVLPMWDFEIAENPVPGQYRFAQFAWKALEPGTTGLGMTLGGMTFYAGQPVGPEPRQKITDAIPRQWEVVTVDLWEALGKKPARLQSMNFTTSGGAGGFDRILLGRSKADLP